MSRRKGELTSAGIDQGWPYQVALAARLCRGDRYYTIHYFCEGLTLCPRRHSFYREREDFIVYCFAVRDHAEQFRDKFGGEFYDPKTRPKM